MELFSKLFGKKQMVADKAPKVDGRIKKIRFILVGILAILTLSANLVSADCVEDCQSIYAFCASLCSADPGGDNCRLKCVRSLNSCIKKCTKKSSNSTNGLQSASIGALPNRHELPIDRIDKISVKK